MECHGDRRPGRYINTGLEQKTPRSVSWTLMVSPIDVFPRQAAESDALLSPSASREGWLNGEVGAFDSHEQGAREESDCSGSRVKRVLTRSEDKVDKAENDTVTLNQEKGEVHPQRKDMTPNVTGVAFGVRSVVAWRKTVTLNEENSEVRPGRKDMTPNAPRAAFGVRSVVAWRKTVTLNEEKSKVPPRRKDMTPNAPWAAFGVRSVAAWRHLKTSSHDKCGEQCCSHPSRPADRGGLAGYTVRSMRLISGLRKSRIAATA